MRTRILGVRCGDEVNGFRVETHHVGVTSVTTAAGEIDSYTAGRFRQELLAAVAGSDSTVVVDLLNVETMDSSALGALLDAHARAQEADVELILVFDDPVIARTMQIAGLDTVFTCAESLAQATRAQ